MNDRGGVGSPLFIGFLAKRVTTKPDWLDSDAVMDICSVSDCVAKAAAAVHGSNAFALHDSLDSALERVPPDRQDVEVFAYRVWPTEYDGTGEKALDPDSSGFTLPDEPALSHWQRIGYDVVAADDERHAFMWHSPLSCNSVAKYRVTNRHCLVDKIDDAIAIAREFADLTIPVEPGPYLVVEVLRDPDRRWLSPSLAQR